MKKLLLAIILLVTLLPVTAASASPSPLVVPTFSIQNVVVDSEVTIKTAHFPAGDNFVVRMGAYGTLGIGGIVVANQASGAGGSFTATYAIPAALYGSTRIAIRLESPTSGYYSYNWFWNNTAAAPGPAPTPGLIPTFSIQDVVEDDEVTIKTKNFPASDTFNVYLGAYGTLGIGGTLVDTLDSGAGGALTATFDIPAGLHGSTRIAIRLESPTSGYYAFNWFWNNTTDGVVPPPDPGVGLPPAGVIPTFLIIAVDADNTVTIKAVNFTKNDSYTVRMGAYGTYGLGGVVVGTQTTDGTGAFTATYTIPASLYGSTRIAIRLDSPSTGYYSFNWFWNNDAP